MKLKKRIIAFVRLGEALRATSQGIGVGDWKRKPSILTSAIQNAGKHNGWFTEENVLLAIGSLGKMLIEEKIRKWISNYSTLRTPNSSLPSRVGVIMAGNIPLVGFHDFLCVLISGNIFAGKLSSDDEFLLPAVAKILIEIEPAFADKIYFTRQPIGKSKNVSAFIATGSNNSARYFEYYFRKYPHIIRKNRNSVAILDGTETETDLKFLGKDIFQYFGMGCRSVSKIYIPKDYDLDRFFAAIVDFGDVINHNKYYNNHIYYRTIYLLNKEKFLDNNFLMLKEDNSIASPVATLYYERYNNQNDLLKKLLAVKEQIQCIVTSSPALFPKEKGVACVGFGQSQSPELWDYADGIDTMEFLIRIKN